MKKPVRLVDGEHWFTASYAAQLLGTTRSKIVTMVVRELLRSQGEGSGLLIAESDVTRLRRNRAELAELKKAAAEPAYPRRSQNQPKDTVYVGNAPKAELRVKGRMGNPLADQGFPRKG